jgi:hypothetical protein
MSYAVSVRSTWIMCYYDFILIILNTFFLNLCWGQILETSLVAKKVYRVPTNVARGIENDEQDCYARTSNQGSIFSFGVIFGQTIVPDVSYGCAKFNDKFESRIRENRLWRPLKAAPCGQSPCWRPATPLSFGIPKTTRISFSFAAKRLSRMCAVTVTSL